MTIREKFVRTLRAFEPQSVKALTMFFRRNGMTYKELNDRIRLEALKAGLEPTECVRKWEAALQETE